MSGYIKSIGTNISITLLKIYDALNDTIEPYKFEFEEVYYEKMVCRGIRMGN